MHEWLHFVAHAIAVGTVATALLDLAALWQQRALGVPMADYAMVGRWIGHFRHGRLRHFAIAAATPIAGERGLGWLVHYGTGVAFAAVLLGLCGPGWAHAPTLGPALLLGLATVAAPFLIMQPAFGAGLAASRTPHPWAARRRSLVAHLSFGLGLYLAAEAWVQVGRWLGSDFLACAK